MLWPARSCLTQVLPWRGADFTLGVSAGAMARGRADGRPDRLGLAR
jgi:hypothetical protein